MALSDLDFSPSLSLQKEILARLGSSISPSPLSPGFILVASFSQSAIRINEDSAALILQSCLGAQAAHLRVGFLSSWCFRFEVSSKVVGLFIYGLKSFACKSFALWGDGGPNWACEFVVWYDQKDREWTLVTPERSYASVVKSLPIGSSSRPSSVFRRLRYPADYQNNFSEEISVFAKHGQADLRPTWVFHRLGPIRRNSEFLLSNQSVAPVRHVDRAARVSRRTGYSNSKSEHDLGAVSNLNENILITKNISHEDQSSRLIGHTNLGRRQRVILWLMLQMFGVGPLSCNMQQPDSLQILF
jgi:hypothetical protein